MNAAKVLIVEDEALVAMNIQNQLEEIGYEVPEPTSSGKRALELITVIRPDLVLMDIVLRGDNDGIETAEVIRKEHNIPVVYLTSHSDTATITRALKTQPYAYITKPFTETSLRTTIEIALVTHRYENRLKESEEQIKLLLNSTAEGIYGFDVDGKCTFCNQSCLTLLGYDDKKQLLGQNVEMLVRPPLPTEDAHPKHNSRINSILLNQTTIHSEDEIMWKADGKNFQAECRSSPIFKNQQVVGGVLTFLDVTEKKKTAAQLTELQANLEKTIEERTQELSESEHRFRSLVETTSDWVWEISHEGVFVYSSPKVMDIIGYKPEEVIQKSQFDFMEMEEAKRFQTLFSSFIQSNKPFAGLEFRCQHKNGHEVALETSGVPIIDSECQLYGYRGITRDITERKEVEKMSRIRQKQLVQADKMTSLGILVSGVAHEINNPNHNIMSNICLIQRIWDGITPILQTYSNKNGDFIVGGLSFSYLKKQMPDIISRIQSGSVRIASIVSELRGFAYEERNYSPEPVDINAVINSVTALLSNMIKKSTIKLQLNMGKDIPILHGSYQRLEQVFVNLLQNACQALPDIQKGIFISSQYDQRNNLIIVNIKDEGCGISQKNLNRVFDPFFTTKRDLGGTGLGLSISTTIINEHGGSLSLQSELGIGTDAQVAIPLCNGKNKK